METTDKDDWSTVSVSVAPSTVSISFLDGREPIECRVRFLSFLGIGSNVQQAAFIMHTAQNTFMCHVFHCEPTAGPLCKTIEAACKLRYQKCLDARPTSSREGQEGSSSRNSIGATIKNLFGGFGKRGMVGDGSWPEYPASDHQSGYVPLTPCPTRSPRLPGADSLKKSISTPSLHSLIGFVTDNTRTSFLPSLSELEQLKVALSPLSPISPTLES